MVDDDLVPFFSGLLLAYGASAVALAIAARRAGGSRGEHLVLLPVFFLAGHFLYLLLSEFAYPRSILLLAVPAVYGFLAWAVLAPVRLRLPSLIALGAVALGTVGYGLALPAPDPMLGEFVLVRTSHETMAFTHYQDRFGDVGAHGGALAAFDDRVLVATANGKLHLLDFDHDEHRLEVTEVAVSVPINRDAFARAAAEAPFAPETRWFRVADILVQALGSSFRLFAAHHYWNSNEQCAVLRVSVLEGQFDAFESIPANAEWKTLFETTPCVPFRTPDPSNPNDHAFPGHFAGGVLALPDEGHLLLALGDHGLDGVYDARIISQDPDASWGKTRLIDLASGTDSTFTTGHRNPLGLYITPEGEIWMTENGPSGGDELNLLEAGSNYGWPLTTLGTDYEKETWPLSPEVGRHRGFREPVYAWVPSIGVSGLIRVEGDLFPSWKGDFLVGSMKDGAMWRTRVEGGRVLFVERIGFGRRIRDLLEAPDGTLIVLQEQEIEDELRATITTIRAPSEAQVEVSRGEILFATCLGCHRPQETEEMGIAPPLEGVFGRRIASVTGFTYSSALRSRSGRWAEPSLDRFLEDPQAFAPGTSMSYGGLTDPNDRAALIQHLRTID